MANGRSFLAACGIWLGVALHAPALSQVPQAGPFIAAGAPVEAPRGFLEMCRSGGSFCAGQSDSVGAPFATGAVSPASIAAPGVADDRPDTRVLRQINLLVNRRVRQVTDAEQFGRDEYWRRPGLGRGAAGDCEDIAIEKRHLLIEAGIDPRTLRFAVVYTPQVGAHVVLVARTASGDVVLDSLTPLVRRWDATAYLWVSIQSAEQPDHWTLVDMPRPSIAVAAARAASRAG